MTQNAIKINGCMIPFIDVHSPTTIFLSIIDSACEIKQMNVGEDIDEMQLSILLYADDSAALIEPDVVPSQKDVK